MRQHPDCNDASPTTYPDAPETCDGYDTDCDGDVDNDPACDGSCDLPAKNGSGTLLSSFASGNPSIASAGSEYGVVWHDDRTGSWQIYFARFDATGARLGSDVQVSAGTNARFATVVWTGSEFGVAWMDNSVGNWEIYLARLDAAGNKLGAESLISSTPDDSDFPVLVWTGAEYGVVWEDYRHGAAEIYFARVDRTGAKVGTDVRVTSATGHSWEPVVVWTGLEYGVVWYDFRAGSQILFTRLDATGNEIGDDVELTSVSGWAQSPSLSWNGSGYGVVWEDYRDGGDPEIYFAPLNASGGQSGQEVRVTNDPAWSFYAKIVWTGSEYGVIWLDERSGQMEPHFARLSSTGSKSGGDVRLFSTGDTQALVALAWNGTNFGMVWWEGRSSSGEAFFALIRCDCTDVDGDGASPNCSSDCADANPNCTFDCTDADGDGYCADTDCDDGDASTNPSAPERSCDGIDNDCDTEIDEDQVCDTSCDLPGAAGDVVRFTSGLSNQPSAVQRGSGYAVAWKDQRILLQNAEIYFARLDASGNKVGSDVRVTEMSGSSTFPRMVWTGNGYGVAWLDTASGSTQVWFAQVDAAGNRLGDEVQVTAPPAEPSAISLVWSGNGYGLAWHDQRPIVSEAIYFARLDSAGAMIGSEVPITSAPNDSEYPHLVWTGSEYGLAWGQRNLDEGVYFARLDASGGQIGSNLRLSTTGLNPHIIWTGSEYGLVFTEATHFMRLDPSGNVLSDVELSTAGWHSWLAWTGSEYGVVFGSVYSLVFARFDASGAQIAPLADVDSDWPVRLNTPIVLWNFGEYGVIWRYEADRQLAFRRVACDCPNPDGDRATTCWPDCDETDPNVFPGANQSCDGLNNDCDDPSWPAVPVDEVDSDGDGLRECAGDCDGANPTIYPGAPQLCDGLNNDCDEPGWPAVPAAELDTDVDGYRPCEGDCDDANASINPDGFERCNARDDDCNGLTDDDENGEDSDGDSVANLCDNCPTVDNAPQTDSDLDSLGDACDNCPADANSNQADFDGDLEGDRCDPDDGLIYIYFDGSDPVEWHAEGFGLWNCYRGDMDFLRSTGIYTQALGSNALADQSCGLTSPSLQDLDPMPSRKVAFYLATGVGMVEIGLGADGSGIERPNDNPCATP